MVLGIDRGPSVFCLRSLQRESIFAAHARSKFRVYGSRSSSLLHEALGHAKGVQVFEAYAQRTP